MSRELFQYICQWIRDILVKEDTSYSLCIPVRKLVAFAIWALAGSRKYRTISHLCRVGLSTVFNCVQGFWNSVIRMFLPVHITIPDATKLIEMATFFSNSWRVPQCVGAIDGSHIPIIAPREYPRDYYNYKEWHSVVLQAVVLQAVLWDVCVGFPGSLQNARVL